MLIVIFECTRLYRCGTAARARVHHLTPTLRQPYPDEMARDEMWQRKDSAARFFADAAPRSFTICAARATSRAQAHMSASDDAWRRRVPPSSIAGPPPSARYARSAAFAVAAYCFVAASASRLRHYMPGFLFTRQNARRVTDIRLFFFFYARCAYYARLRCLQYFAFRRRSIHPFIFCRRQSQDRPWKAAQLR